MRRILNDEEYATTFAEVDRLMSLDPVPETLTGKRLLELSERVEEYERRRWPLVADTTWYQRLWGCLRWPFTSRS